ncbi:MAG: hypothetical protein JST51_08655 [Armatimonadetes bacterium]|nr:hypothetical protein [Armatimonadota bacterium]
MNFNINLGPERQAKKPSSIDRFFWAKSGKLFAGSINNFSVASWIMSINFTLAAIVFVILSLAVRGFPLALAATFVPLAIASIILAVVLRIRIKKPLQPEIKITGSGRKLLHRIGSHIGWYDPDAARGYQHNQWGNWWQSVFGIKTASDVLTAQSTELLEAGCTHYNRLAGLLKLAKDSQGRSSNFAPQIQAASDEAMISLINQIGLLEDNPETQAAIVSQCGSQIHKLKELADRYEEMLSGPTTLVDHLSSTTVMDNVLDQLRMEAKAQEELRVMDRLND